jgi:hypothetical protein
MAKKKPPEDPAAFALRKWPLFKKSGAKTFIYAGSWALSAPTPMTQHSKVFLLLFVHKK